MDAIYVRQYFKNFASFISIEYSLAFIPTVRISALASIIFSLSMPYYSHAAQIDMKPESQAMSLSDLSLEELMNVEVTSVSKSEEKLKGAAAAITVVSNEDIRRSGATTIPGALRMVPGLHVAKQNSSSWAVSSRGFSSINSEKLLVLSDTRSIYTPLYSGVFWDAQDYLLKDIERIEVIRGPGASLWGSNAVNGVINITTKKAQDTQGIYTEALAGDEEKTTAAARYGGKTESGIYYRIFGKYFNRDDSYNEVATSSDEWEMGHFGFRSDWDATQQDAITVQGETYRGNIGKLVPSIRVIGRPGPQGNLNTDVKGGNILSRWTHTIDANSDFQLRAYYDYTYRDDPSYKDTLDTYDVDMQHRFALTRDQEFIWGLNYRETLNKNTGKVIFAIDPESSRDRTTSMFVQDQITFIDTVRLTLGTKLEHNDFSGTEWQPSGRVAWDFLPDHTIWTAVSRAARIPTRIERDIAVDATNPAGNPVLRLLGNDSFDAEKMLAYEIGYRWQATDQLSFDLAAFQNHYDGLASLELGTPFISAADGGRTIVPILNKNLNDGRTEGFEALITWAPMTNWRISTNYSYLEMKIDPDGLDINRGRYLEGATPRHQFGIRSSVDLSDNVEFDIEFRHLSEIESIPDIVDGTGLPDYSEINVRLAKKLNKQTEISLVGQNLLDSHHPEFGAPELSGEVERSIYGKIVWEF